MMIPINVAADILKQALDFTSEVVGKFDEEKYAKAVAEIYGHEPDYSELDELTELIKNATDISTKDKNDLLLAITDKKTEIRKKELEYKRECAKIVDAGSERKAEIALKILNGVLIVLAAGCTAFGVAKGMQNNQSQLRIEPRKRR